MSEPLRLVTRAIPDSIPLKVTEIIPRLKEGGAYVKFTYPAGTSAAEVEGMSSISPGPATDEHSHAIQASWSDPSSTSPLSHGSIPSVV